jgi:peptide deformylase
MFTNDFINIPSEMLTEYDDVKQIEMELLNNIGNGVGIAAVQIGITKSIIIVKINGEFVTIVNPVITSKSIEKKASKEGCLSFPNKIVKKQRHYRVTLQGVNTGFEPVIYKLSGLAAYIAQHEVDHVNGIHI